MQDDGRAAVTDQMIGSVTADTTTGLPQPLLRAPSGQGYADEYVDPEAHEAIIGSVR